MDGKESTDIGFVIKIDRYPESRFVTQREKKIDQCSITYAAMYLSAILCLT